MQKYIASLLLTKMVTAQGNADGDATGLPDWQLVEGDLTYTDDNEWKSCATDTDCTENHLCLQHMWAYNGQTESGQGCW